MSPVRSLKPRTDVERWRDELIDYFKELGGAATLAQLYKHIEGHPKRKLRGSWQKRVRFTIYENSSDSDIWDGEHDLFQQVGDKHSGVWALKAQGEHLVANDSDGFNEDVGSTIPPERRKYVRRVILRNRKITRTLKKLRDYTCERCGVRPSWLTAGGVPYIEAHHLIPLGENGFDDVRNLLIVCAGCHRFLHHAIDRESEITRLLDVRGLRAAAIGGSTSQESGRG